MKLIQLLCILFNFSLCLYSQKEKIKFLISNFLFLLFILIHILFKKFLKSAY